MATAKEAVCAISDYLLPDAEHAKAKYKGAESLPVFNMRDIGALWSGKWTLSKQLKRLSINLETSLPQQAEEDSRHKEQIIIVSCVFFAFFTSR